MRLAQLVAALREADARLIEAGGGILLLQLFHRHFAKAEQHIALAHIVGGLLEACPGLDIALARLVQCVAEIGDVAQRVQDCPALLLKLALGQAVQCLLVLGLRLGEIPSGQRHFGAADQRLGDAELILAFPELGERLIVEAAGLGFMLQKFGPFGLHPATPGGGLQTGGQLSAAHQRVDAAFAFQAACRHHIHQDGATADQEGRPADNVLIGLGLAERQEIAAAGRSKRTAEHERTPDDPVPLFLANRSSGWRSQIRILGESL